jgi:hypothetical protein
MSGTDTRKTTGDADALARKLVGLNLDELSALREAAPSAGDDDDGGPRVPPRHRRNGRLAGGLDTPEGGSDDDA